MINIEQFVPVVQNNGLNTGKAVDFTESPSVALPAGTTINGSSVAALGVVTSTSAHALAVGRQGSTNPVLNVDASATTVVTGINIVGAAAGARVAMIVTSSGTNEDLSIDSKGSGTIRINVASGTGAVLIGTATNIAALVDTPAGGSAAGRLLFGTTAGFGIYYGSSTPTVSAAKGSLYLCSDGSSSSTRLFVNSSGSTTWVAVTTAS